MSSGLSGLNVAIFESRLQKTMADLVALRGGVPFSAPSMKEVPLENNPEAFRFAERLFTAGGAEGKIDILILLTGVGTRTLVSVLETRYPKEKIIDALRQVLIVPRGPKPVKVLQEWGVPYALTVPEPNTWREILSALDQNKGRVPVQGRTVAVQEYGAVNPELISGLEARGAKVLSVPVYRWALPDDLAPLKTVIRKMVDGQMDAAIFTTAVQIDHVFQVARQMRVEAPLKEAFKKLAVASVGPDASAAIRSYGVEVDIQPESPKMGPLVAETAEKAKAVLEQKRAREDCAADVRSAVLQVATTEEKLQNSVFLKACRREKTPTTPIWLMRQAGRYMKDYRALRDRHSFLALCRDKDLVTEITVKAQETINADAAIIFSDILLVLDAWGLGLEYTKGDGPLVRRPVSTAADVERLLDIDPSQSLRFVLDAIKQTRAALKPHIPLIGFAGAPFTLASYMIEGGASKDFRKTKECMRSGGGLWEPLMEKIVRVTSAYLCAQAAAGAQVVQVFDSWAGCLDRGEYERFVLPFSKKLIAEIRRTVPVIHFGTGTAPFLDFFASTGCQVVGVDHRISLKDAWEKIGPDQAIQGNLDPETLLKPRAEIRKEVKRILEEAAGRPGHIFNLGHGVLPATPLENVIALVETVHELSHC